LLKEPKKDIQIKISKIVSKFREKVRVKIKGYSLEK
jgi:hypothetical protein